jgi:MOSC domain-containing protein YiiM
VIRVLSVNVGAEQVLRVGARDVPTGIDKQPVERALVGPLGLEGDVVADQVNHGGPDQAVYLYSREDYAWWEGRLARTLAPGSFGENLTLTSFGEEPVRIGDRFRVGGTLLQATAPRIPCSVFATHIREDAWVKRFAAAERAGIYARVLEPGEVAAGDPVERLDAADGEPELVELTRVWLDPRPPRDLLERLLASPLAERARADVAAKLARL